MYHFMYPECLSLYKYYFSKNFFCVDFMSGGANMPVCMALAQIKIISNKFNETKKEY